MASEEGKGSEFTVSVPCPVSGDAHARTSSASKDRTSESTEKPEDNPALFSGKRALLAEDNVMNQMIAQAILTEHGFDVETVEDGAAAVEKMKTMPAGYYDIILMDIQMPVMNGYEAAKQIRALDDRSKAAIPIVAVTANAFEEDRQISLDAGMNGHLTKPYDVSVMIETLNALL